MVIDLKLFEKKITSQNGEDGIIEKIFEVIGTTNKIAVEIGVTSGGNGMENNTRNLSSAGWKLFWLDCKRPEFIPSNCKFIENFLTVNNVCDVLEENNIPYNLDFLSIDIDSNDYHIRQILSNYRPRVYVMEYNGSIDSKTRYIMPRNDSYRWGGKKDTSFGASLLSMTEQGESLGYDLVYCESQGVNCFFVKKEINVLPKKTAQEAWVKLFWAKKI